jgi:2-(1,2-epoxy-1,2-dihydrophenyl)acetyl-CoA isomerase
MAVIETGTEDLLAELEAGVLTLTFNRPQARNAVTQAMAWALADQLAAAEADPQVRCVVLTGAGQAFCAGGDVKAMDARNSASEPGQPLHERIPQQQASQRATSARLFRFPKPTLAALPGAAVGAGLSFALACDVRIMADTAFLVTGFARMGVPGDGGGTYFLSQLVGAAKARELYFLSDRVGAEEALRLGLTNWIAAPDQLAGRARDIALRLAKGPAVAYRYMKENLNAALAGEAEDCLDLEANNHNLCKLTHDHREAARAFVEKREPVFQGR